MTPFLVWTTLLFAIQPPPGLREALRAPGNWLVRDRGFAIPPTVRQAFTKASSGEMPFYMAEPGGEWNSTDLRHRGLPSLRLGRVMSTSDFCVVTYERGGFALSDRVAVFRFRRGGADLVWSAESASLITGIPELVRAIDGNQLGDTGGEL